MTSGFGSSRAKARARATIARNVTLRAFFLPVWGKGAGQTRAQSWRKGGRWPVGASGFLARQKLMSVRASKAQESAKGKGSKGSQADTCAFRAQGARVARQCAFLARQSLICVRASAMPQGIAKGFSSSERKAFLAASRNVCFAFQPETLCTPTRSVRLARFRFGLRARPSQHGRNLPLREPRRTPIRSAGKRNFVSLWLCFPTVVFA